MKQKIVPTSPKSPHKQQREENRDYRTQRVRRPHIIAALLFSSLTIGAVAGFAGFLVAANIPSQWPVVGQFNIASRFENQRQTVLLSTAEREKSVVDEAPQVLEQSVAMYNQLPVIGTPATLLGNAVVLTSDGWCVAPGAVFAQLQPVPVFSDGTTAEISSVIQDDFSGLTFFKVDRENVSPVQFTDSTTVSTGHWVSVLEQQLGQYNIYERRVSSANSPSQPVSSLTLNQRYTLDTFGEQHIGGASVFSNTGEFVGIVDTQGNMIHSSIVKGQLDSLLQSGKLDRVSDAVEYIHLKHLTADEKEKKELPDDGILITNAGDTILQKDDVIVSINNVVVDDNTDFGSTLNSRAAQTSFLLGLVREKENRTLDYTTQGLAK